MSSSNVSWKGEAGQKPVWNGIVASNSRPSENGIAQNPEDYQSAFGTARPLKLWRKQLVPPQPTTSSLNKVGVDQAMAPGGTVMTGSISDCADCGGATDVGFTKTLIQGNNSYLTEQTPNNVHSGAVKLFNPETGVLEACVSCDPTSNVIKSATTVLDKKYYSDSSAYLKARCKSYAQKSSTIPIAGNTYINPNGTPAIPTDSNTGSQAFKMGNCSQQCPGTEIPITIYKPSNSNFGVQGAVSSSTRIMRLKQNTVNNNASSFASAYGMAAVNAARYSANPVAPYFIKSKENKCNRSTYFRTGKKVMCFNA